MGPSSMSAPPAPPLPLDEQPLDELPVDEPPVDEPAVVLFALAADAPPPPVAPPVPAALQPKSRVSVRRVAQVRASLGHSARGTRPSLHTSAFMSRVFQRRGARRKGFELRCRIARAKLPRAPFR